MHRDRDRIEPAAAVVPFSVIALEFGRDVSTAVSEPSAHDGLLDGGEEFDPGAYEFVP